MSEQHARDKYPRRNIAAIKKRLTKRQRAILRAYEQEIKKVITPVGNLYSCDEFSARRAAFDYTRNGAVLPDTIDNQLNALVVKHNKRLERMDDCAITAHYQDGSYDSELLMLERAMWDRVEECMDEAEDLFERHPELRYETDY